LKFCPDNSISNHAEPEGIISRFEFLLNHWFNPVTQFGHIRSTRWQVRQRFEKTTKYIPIEIIFFVLGILWVVVLANFADFFTVAVRDDITDWRIYGTPQFPHSTTAGATFFYKTTLLYPFIIFPIMFGAMAFGPLIGIIVGRNPSQIQALVNPTEPDVLLTTTFDDHEIYNGLLLAPYLTFHRLFSAAFIFLVTIIVGFVAIGMIPWLPMSESVKFMVGIFGGIWGYVAIYVLLAAIGLIAGLMLGQVAAFGSMIWSMTYATASSLLGVPIYLLVSRKVALLIVNLITPAFRDPFVYIMNFYSALPMLLFVLVWFFLMLLASWGLGKLGPWMFSRVRQRR